jgi:tRNA uridine 5-carboxymethylaminomethyl modification enzyme
MLKDRLNADASYGSYLCRQAEDIARYRSEVGILLPRSLDYTQPSVLSIELRQRFMSVRPRSLGQAGRIEGVTPVALALVAAHARWPCPNQKSPNARIASVNG